jgi:hypothetical protein
MPAHPPSATPAAKWWAASKTVWGALITALAALLPALAPLLGFTLPSELIHQLGEQVVLVMQALVALAGTILTIYGRVRATTPLARRHIVLNRRDPEPAAGERPSAR